MESMQELLSVSKVANLAGARAPTSAPAAMTGLYCSLTVVAIFPMVATKATFSLPVI